VIQEQVQTKKYQLSLPEKRESKIVYRPDTIYMVDLLRQDEFLNSQTDERRIAYCTGKRLCD